MFLARRPSRQTIDRFLLDSQDLPLSYGPIGIVRPETARQGVDEAIGVIGCGKADFERARAALIAWKQFDIGWVETFPRHAPVAVGTVVAVLIRHLGFWSLNGCRVLYSVGCLDDAARFGFAYGTLTNHAESGEELFEVFIDPQTDEVIYRIRAVPGHKPRSPGSASQSCACFKNDPRSLSRRDEARDALQRCLGMSIYVEILIRAPMDALWAHTQTPGLHERWDLRFSRIDYLPKPHDTEPQRFRYTTRIGFGFEVGGEGETVGQRDLTDGSRSSALKFGSDEPFSIIREGSGYWKYIPIAEGIRFLTWYEYRTRFGPVGALLDRLIFRPLIGWATAWSFDRLRLWLEQHVDPAQAMRQTLIHFIARTTLAAVFAYQGVVPKLLTRNIDEVAMLHDVGVSAGVTNTAVIALGILELAFAAALLVAWHRRWPVFVCLGSMLLATAVVGLNSPRYFEAAFNPASLNLAVACLAAIDLLVLGSIPSAARCLRRPCPEKA
jgi:uncharacterized protein (UPF0548 family)